LPSMAPRHTVHPEHKKGEAKASPNNLRIGGQLTQERVNFFCLYVDL
jgi:hypothetical protein